MLRQYLPSPISKLCYLKVGGYYDPPSKIQEPKRLSKNVAAPCFKNVIFNATKNALWLSKKGDKSLEDGEFENSVNRN